MHFFSYRKQYSYHLMAFFMCLWVFGALATGKEENKNAINVVASTRLDNVGATSKSLSLPVLLVFFSTSCPYCKMLEDEILRPMLISGDYENKVIIRKLLIDKEHELVDFNGKLVDMGNFVTRHNVHVVPTMLFLDHNGKELAKRLIGINTIEMFGGDVDNAIELSLKKLHK